MKKTTGDKPVGLMIRIPPDVHARLVAVRDRQRETIGQGYSLNQLVLEAIALRLAERLTRAGK